MRPRGELLALSRPSPHPGHKHDAMAVPTLPGELFLVWISYRNRTDIGVDIDKGVGNRHDVSLVAIST
jgi:hypothetical protein